MIKCQNCGSTRLYIQNENINDFCTWNAYVACSQCGAIVDDDRAIAILREAE
jgi:DNA-directed RNA polymerase subunit RPC12/RpoP